MQAPQYSNSSKYTTSEHVHITIRNLDIASGPYEGVMEDEKILMDFHPYG